MIQQRSISYLNDNVNYNRKNVQERTIQELNDNDEQTKASEFYSNKKSQEIKFINHLKSKDIKLSYQKFQTSPNKPNMKLKHISSFQKETSPANDKKSSFQRTSDTEDIKKSIRNRKLQISQKTKKNQKSIQPITSFNPQTITHSRQNMILNRDKCNKKLKFSDINIMQQRTYESRSESKKQKISKDVFSQNALKNTLNNYENQSNIFQNFDLIQKQISYHSLDKNQNNPHRIGINPLISSKIQEKLHLPSLVSNSVSKNVKSRIQPMVSVSTQQHQKQIEKLHFYPQNGPKTQKSSPYIPKTVKIPIDRLKPLKPEEIKFKYLQKVKQEQKNRAKQMAIQIFEKEQEEAELKKLYEKFRNDKQSDDDFINEIISKRVETEQLDFKNKASVSKKQNMKSISKAENIFKKNLLPNKTQQ